MQDCLFVLKPKYAINSEKSLHFRFPVDKVFIRFVLTLVLKMHQ